MTALRQAPRWVAHLLVCSALSLGLSGAANAALISTADAVDSVQAAAARAQMKVLLQRPELAKELKTLGASPAEAQARVDAMTDEEVTALAGKVADLPAGGRLSDNELILILVIVLILII
jgi:Family of unknown function (DUF6627)